MKPSPVPSSTGCNEGGEAQTGHLLFRTLELLSEATSLVIKSHKQGVVYRRNKRRLVLVPDAIGSAPCKALPGWMIAQPRLVTMTMGLLAPQFKSVYTKAFRPVSGRHSVWRLCLCQFLSDPGVPGPIFVSGCPSVRHKLLDVCKT